MSATEKQQDLKKIFLAFSSPQEKYEKIIDMGQSLPPFPAEAKIEKNRVQGCQSLLYLDSYLEDGKIYFKADSDALISKGLAALLIYVYSGEPPQSLFTSPPLFLQEMGLHQALSPTRSNGLASLYRKMKETVIETSG